MKKLALCFFLGMFCTPFAFADGAGTISRAIPTNKSSDALSASPVPATDATVAVRGASTGGTVARTAAVRSPVVSTPNAAATDGDATQTALAANTTVRSGSRVLKMEDLSAAVRNSASAVRGTMTSTTASRATMAGDTSVSPDGLAAAVNTVGRNARVSAASINNNPTLRRAGVILRPSTAEVGGRAKIAGTDIQTGSNIDNSVRSVTARAASSETIEEAKVRLEQTADLNKSCQEQYNDCMDQFCAVIDANQKRCSCSPNLASYAKVEQAVKDANTQLNEVAQRIRYVGLSADEIRAIMTATEAEEALAGTTDTTETRNMLAEIEKLIKDPTSAATYSGDDFAGLDLDLDLDFSAEATDLFSLDFLNTDTASFLNLRGSELYNAAKRRCNTVLNKCRSAGGTPQQITGNYDLAIDKDCIAYEQGLTKMNETLVSNVRSANRMLQKARLAVMQNKNKYDAKGCIGALDACMTDEMVCGADYAKCLDPTKRYIDENGKVVLGRNINNITYFVTAYNNAEISAKFLETTYTNQVITPEACVSASDNSAATGTGDGGCVVKYLLQKIGTKARVTDEGLCRAVLDKCQAYTYDSETDEYKPYNDIVVNYIQRAMVNIKAAQQRIISDYASTCMVDVAQCYNQQVTQVNAWSSTASSESIYKIMRGACRNVALTCSYAIFGNEYSTEDKYIDNISEMFFSSLVCPENSTYNSKCDSATEGVKGGCISSICKCNDGYESWNAKCLLPCDTGYTRNVYGTCTENK